MVLSRATIAAACVLALFSAGLFAGCNDEEQGVDEPAREGLALDLDGVTYNVFITRQLNTAIPPDDAYYAGPQPGKDETLYGVFIQACNHTKDNLSPTGFFKIKDNQENEFMPMTLPADSPFAYRVRELKPDACIPEDGSVAALGPAAASLLLFKLPLQTTENRPLELEIEGEEGHSLTYELDI
jgi:hypothetical protein